METVAALVAAGGAFGASYLVGRSLTSSPPLVALGGLLWGVGFAVLYFVTTVTVRHLSPGLFEPRLLGVHFLALIVGAPVGGATVAALTRWHAERAEAARLAS